MCVPFFALTFVSEVKPPPFQILISRVRDEFEKLYANIVKLPRPIHLSDRVGDASFNI